VACYLEVLARFRLDPTLQAEMDAIESDDDDEFPTISPGRLDYGWCEQRLVCTGRLSGCFAVPSHHETLPTLREQFLPLAIALGLTDVDVAAVREGEPRELTQSMSGWIYEIVGPDGERMNGIQYLSRHGDDFTAVGDLRAGECGVATRGHRTRRTRHDLARRRRSGRGDAHTPDQLAVGRR
jgi:hypothetical protein